jgi:hypothetical protein
MMKLNYQRCSVLVTIVAAASLVLMGLTFMKPEPARAQPSWPTTWIPLDTDGSGPPDCSGVDDFGDVVATYYNTDSEYLYLRMCTDATAGWPSTDPQGEARYKWWIDEHGLLYVAGTLVHHTEYLLILEDLTDNSDDPTLSRDQLGELTLMDDIDLAGFQARWDSHMPPLYAQGNTPEAGTGVSPSPYWRRVLGSTVGAGGVDQASTSDPDIGYAIGYDSEDDCNYVDMYVSWDVMAHGHEFDSICLMWATDINDPNLDQAPNCDRPEEALCDIWVPQPDIDF